MKIFQTDMTTELQITYPIIQAPMAGGITTPDLVATVSNSGGLGMIGAGYLAATDLEKHINRIKSKTDKPFGVNIFIPGNIKHEPEAVQKANTLLQPYYLSYNIDETATRLPTKISQEQTYEQQLNVILETGVSVVSFTFGLPEKHIIQQLQQRGVTLIGTAETVDEALIIEKSGLDMVVLQGSEAGGHRGGINEQGADQQVGLMSLLPQAADILSIPIIAAGGIMDGRGLVAAYTLGAAGIQMGTAFLLTKESGANSEHKNAILSSKENNTVMTKAFSGKLARGLNNDFIQTMKDHEHELPTYPVMNTLTQSIRKAAKEQGNKADMSLWSGQGTRMSKEQTAAQLINTTVQEASTIIHQLN